MRAVLLTGTGGPEMLEVRDDVPVPEPGAGEVLVAVRACGVNNTDLNTRRGWYGQPSGWGGGLSFPRIQGADVCGEVVAAGSGSDEHLVGERVVVDPWVRRSSGPDWRDHTGYLGSEIDGGFAEYCRVPAVNAHPVRTGLSDVELAAVPCSWSTALHLLTRADVGPGDSVAVTGASGGVGSALVQLARLRGARVTAVTSRAKAEAVRGLGADLVVTRDAGSVDAAAVSAAGGPFDVVVDVVGGSDVAAWWRALRRGGRYATSGAVAGPVVEVDLRVLYLSDLTVVGATAFPADLFAELVGIIESGRVRPVVAGTYPLEQIAEAQAAFERHEHLGSIVLTP